MAEASLPPKPILTFHYALEVDTGTPSKVHRYSVRCHKVNVGKTSFSGGYKPDLRNSLFLRFCSHLALRRGAVSLSRDCYQLVRIENSFKYHECFLFFLFLFFILLCFNNYSVYFPLFFHCSFLLAFPSFSIAHFSWLFPLFPLLISLGFSLFFHCSFLLAFPSFLWSYTFFSFFFISLFVFFPLLQSVRLFLLIQCSAFLLFTLFLSFLFHSICLVSFLSFRLTLICPKSWRWQINEIWL